MQEQAWQQLAARQAGMLSRRQLRAAGVTRHHVRNQVAAGRWTHRTPLVVSTTTGPLTWAQRAWTGVLHAGPGSAIGGLSAAKLHGLRKWDRVDVTVLVGSGRDVSAVPGIEFVRTRRDIGSMRLPGTRAPILRIEPAVLLFAAHDHSSRTGCGLLAAVVQQRLSTAPALLEWVELMQPLRRARLFRTTLGDIAGGAESLAEIDVGRLCQSFGLPQPSRQVRRRDGAGALRFTDCEWRLADSHTVVLEVDGAFHMDADHWEADLIRERRLVAEGLTILRCTASELRRSPESVARDLRAAGVG